MGSLKGSLKASVPIPPSVTLGRASCGSLRTCDRQHTHQAPPQPPRKLPTPGAPHARGVGRNRGKVGGGSGKGELSSRLIWVTCPRWEVTEAQGAEGPGDPQHPSTGACTPHVHCHPRPPSLTFQAPPLCPPPVTCSASPPPHHPRLMLYCKLNQGQTEGTRGKPVSGGWVRGQTKAKASKKGEGAVLDTPIPWFAGSKGKSLSWASLCSPNPALIPLSTSPSTGPPCRGRFLGQVASPLRLNIFIYGIMDLPPPCVATERNLQESLRSAWHKGWLRVRA